MSVQPAMALEEIRRAGLQALVRELGPVRAIRFLQQFETGTGNYSEERHRWLGDADVSALARAIRAESDGGTS